MNTKNNKAFTLIELIIYIGIASLIMVAVINTSWNLIVANSRNDVRTDVYYTARQVMHQLETTIHAAEDIITSSSTLNSNPGVLILDMPGSQANITLNTTEQTVTIGGKSTTITTMQWTQGSDTPIELTPETITISNLVFSNLTRGSEPKNIQINMTLERANPGNDPNFDASIDLQTSYSLRK